MPLTDHFRNSNPVLKPSGFLIISVLLHMLRIIRMVIYECHCAETVITFYKHSLWVKVGESERTHDLGHAGLAAKFNHCVKQSG